MKKFLLIATAAAALTPAAMSFANTQAPAAAMQDAPAAVKIAVAQNSIAGAPQAESNAGCKTVRVAYAGYGEASRACPAGSAGLLLTVPGRKAAQ